MFLKKLLILVFLSCFAPILLAEDETQQYDYLTYTINVVNNSGVTVKVNAESNNTSLSSVSLKTSDITIDNQKNGVLPIADVMSAVSDPSEGPTWYYSVKAVDNSFSCYIEVASDAEGVSYLKTNTTVHSDPDYETFCTLDCNEAGIVCNDTFPRATSKDTPHTITYTLTISKP